MNIETRQPGDYQSLEYTAPDDMGETWKAVNPDLVIPGYTQTDISQLPGTTRLERGVVFPSHTSLPAVLNVPTRYETCYTFANFKKWSILFSLLLLLFCVCYGLLTLFLP